MIVEVLVVVSDSQCQRWFAENYYHILLSRSIKGPMLLYRMSLYVSFCCVSLNRYSNTWTIPRKMSFSNENCYHSDSHRVSEQAEENKMTASNLGIIFGPTLVKPQHTDAEVSLSSLVDYPYQALMVEQLVKHFQTVFDASFLPSSDTSSAGQASPRLTPQEKIRQLSRHSTSLTDIKEVRRD